MTPIEPHAALSSTISTPAVRIESLPMPQIFVPGACRRISRASAPPIRSPDTSPEKIATFTALTPSPQEVWHYAILPRPFVPSRVFLIKFSRCSSSGLGSISSSIACRACD